MAYERKGRHTHLPARVQKPSGRVEATADLPSSSQYSGAVSARSGAVSVVGRPVAVFDTLPAGTDRFSVTYYKTLPQDIDPSEPIVLAEFLAPVGRVMVIESFEVRLVPYAVGNSGNPFYAARIMNTGGLKASITKNKQKQLGAADVSFHPFDGDAECHVIFYSDQKGEVVANLASPLNWEDHFQKVEVILTGNYLLPNLQAPEYTELEIGAVKVVNNGA